MRARARELGISTSSSRGDSHTMLLEPSLTSEHESSPCKLGRDVFYKNACGGVFFYKNAWAGCFLQKQQRRDGLKGPEYVASPSRGSPPSRPLPSTTALLHQWLRHSGPLRKTTEAAAAVGSKLNGASRRGAPAIPPLAHRRRRGGPSSSCVARPAGEHLRPGGRRARGEECLRGSRGWGVQFQRRDQGLLPSPSQRDPPRRRRGCWFPTVPSDPRCLRGI